MSGTANLLLESGESIPTTHCIWAAGAAAHSLTTKLKHRGLAVSDYGWIRVNDNLQSISHPNVFAVGDCCTIEGLPEGRSSPPKAGVYAVRSGPVLSINLPAFLQTKPLESYSPQDDFLKLIACGDGTAIGFRFGLTFQGKWVFEMKDSIDQMFMNLFKKENLPEHLETDSATIQFDALLDEFRVRLTPEEAARLLQRTDTDVEYTTAWHTIRDITQDVNYRKAVLECIGKK
jgi:selenide, water dikinase